MSERMLPSNDPWQDGWYAMANKLESPNFGPRPAQACIDLLVLHSISLPPGHFGGDAVQQLFTNRLDWNAHPYYQEIEGIQVSSHFYIRRTGDIWQFVSCNDRAWHAGVSHYRGRSNCNDDSIGIELEGLEGGLFEQAQYDAVVELCAHLVRHYPLEHIAGHEHIAPGRKSDPGPGLQWKLLQKKLQWPAQCFPVGVL